MEMIPFLLFGALVVVLGHFLNKDGSFKGG